MYVGFIWSVTKSLLNRVYIKKKKQYNILQWECCKDGDDVTEALEDSSPTGGQAMAAQLNNIRLKLEEKRRRIEQDKRRMELAVNRQRQQLGQQAFLQAVTRVSVVCYTLYLFVISFNSIWRCFVRIIFCYIIFLLNDSI